jgi:hypothetical protein
MKQFRSLLVVSQPAEPLWRAIRDRLSDVAQELDDIEGVRVLSREDLSSTTVRLVNEWRARLRIPAALEAAIGRDALGWIDTAIWNESEMRCRWSIEPLFLRGQVHCEGATTYEKAMGGRGARVTFEGELSVALSSGGRTSLGLDAVSSFVEPLVTTLIPRNFKKTLDAAARLVERTR